MFSLYRNSHFIAPREVARAITHLMSIPDASLKGIETYNIADSNAPTFAQFYRRSGRKTGPHIPFLFDFLKGAKTGKGFSRRLPMGAFRLDDRKLRETGFQHKS
ncbi:NAD-dependent epimerase/dehydratase family protein [Kozakia baliensis]|uniref:hypothetical protein n=1 Tax=Kozakia baliensis TaxID=153496 RepID=UPI00049625A2|nr:hypothetical protein [Kozakia baliensis]